MGVFGMDARSAMWSQKQTGNFGSPKFSATGKEI
jgi:hypothetical protein